MEESATTSFRRLPEELLAVIFEYLEPQDLPGTSLVCKRFYSHSLPLLWRSVELVDCHTSFEYWTPNPDGSRRDEVYTNDHDDSPLRRKLELFARYPHVAEKVITLTHRCHLPPPDSFLELPKMPFKSPYISEGLDLACLLKLAIRNLKNVQTLRILYGHWHIAIGLIIGFFDRRRTWTAPVRRLWLENCSIEGIFRYEQDRCDFSQLESVRFRRMRLAPDPIHTSIERALAPEGDKQSMHDGKGGLYYTSLHQASDISAFNTPLAGLDDAENGKICAEYVDPREVFAMAELYERGPPAKIPDEYDLLNDGMINEYLEVHKDVLKLGPWAESLFAKRELLIRLRAAKNDPANFAARLLVGSMAALTSLNLDWVFLMCNRRTESEYHTQYAMPLLETICKLRFPNLRAFQLRNAVTHGTMLQDLVPLFGTSGLSFLDFMEAHQSLQCLGWPLAHFFMAHREARDVRDRIDRVIENLSTSITDLRVDARYHGSGEPQSQTDERLGSLAERQRRRLFITDFASRMQKVKHIKIEGCIPRDERREILRALRKCHLKRIISIGLSSPLGNTWGEHGVDIRELDDGYFVANDFLEAEDTDAITALATSPLQPPKEPYIPSFGWGPGPPLLHTIASHHAATITELKFCGYQGAPIVGCPTPITASFLYPLRHFHELRQLMLSMWLRTFFEDDWQDPDIIRYWVDSRDPSSTALVPVPVDGEEGPESGAWARQLRECYAPDVLARQVRNAVAEHLSPRAKERKGGVRVRASFSLGEEVSNNFDIDVWIGKDDEILEFQGPREEFEPERRREKLESRKWF